MAPVKYPREEMHRIKYTKLTPEQIGAKLAAVNGPASVSSFSNAFAGQSLKIVLDNGPALSYRFTASNRLSLTEGDAAPVQADYGALTLDRSRPLHASHPSHAASVPGRKQSSITCTGNSR